MPTDFSRHPSSESISNEVEGSFDAFRLLVDLLNGLDLLLWEAHPQTLLPSFLSEQMSMLLGYSDPQETLSENFFERSLHPDDRAGILALFRAVAADGKARIDEHRLQAADGSYLWFRTKVLRVQSPQGPKLRGFMVNITEQKQTESKFQGLLESAPDAIILVDAEGRIITINHLAEQMFGYQRGELIGRPVESLVSERDRKRHLGYRTRYLAAPKTRPMGEGRPLSGLKKDGSEFPIEISLSPLQTERGEVVMSIIRDVSQRKEAEAKFRGLLESAPDGIVVVDGDGRMVIVNTQVERIFGYTRKELLGQPVEVLVPSRFKEGHVGLRDGYLRDPHTRPMGAGRNLTGRKKDGSEIPVEISLSPMETDQGTLVTSIIRDITDRRRAEEQIKASLREKEVLLKEIHHRVKNNLQVTSSLLKLQSGYIRDKKARDLFAESQNRIRSMALVHEKLYQSSDLSRINFSDYVRSLANLLFRSFGEVASRIALRVSGENIFLSVETAVPCGLIINELLSNALKHAFPGGRQGEIRIHLSQEGPHRFCICVRDTGVGLPPELDFQRAETLGLQLVQTLIQQLGGEMQVRSESGAEFRLTFSETKEST